MQATPPSLAHVILIGLMLQLIRTAAAAAQYRGTRVGLRAGAHT